MKIYKSPGHSGHIPGQPRRVFISPYSREVGQGTELPEGIAIPDFVPSNADLRALYRLQLSKEGKVTPGDVTSYRQEVAGALATLKTKGGPDSLFTLYVNIARGLQTPKAPEDKPPIPPIEALMKLSILNSALDKEVQTSPADLATSFQELQEEILSLRRAVYRQIGLQNFQQTFLQQDLAKLGSTQLAGLLDPLWRSLGAPEKLAKLFDYQYPYQEIPSHNRKPLSLHNRKPLSLYQATVQYLRDVLLSTLTKEKQEVHQDLSNSSSLPEDEVVALLRLWDRQRRFTLPGEHSLTSLMEQMVCWTTALNFDSKVWFNPQQPIPGLPSSKQAVIRNKLAPLFNDLLKIPEDVLDGLTSQTMQTIKAIQHQMCIYAIPEERLAQAKAYLEEFVSDSADKCPYARLSLLGESLRLNPYDHEVNRAFISIFYPLVLEGQRQAQANNPEEFRKFIRTFRPVEQWQTIGKLRGKKLKDEFNCLLKNLIEELKQKIEIAMKFFPLDEREHNSLEVLLADIAGIA